MVVGAAAVLSQVNQAYDGPAQAGRMCGMVPIANCACFGAWYLQACKW